MSFTTTEYNPLSEYTVVTVEQIEPPTGGIPGSWYRYVIQRGESTIDGQHAGDLHEVTEHAENFAESLNERLTKKIYAYGSQPKK